MDADQTVWARQTSYPYFPAEIIDYTDDDMDIPPAVLDLQPDMTNEVFWLIRFFDAQASYAWIPRKRLDMLGEDDGESWTCIDHCEWKIKYSFSYM
jgi:NuA3 HAT complex component NTO1